MVKLSSLLWGAAIGAGMMYFMDPQNGNRRKAMIRDRATRYQNQGDEALQTAVSDLRHRVRGVLAEGMALVDENSAPDVLIEERIRSRMGFLSRHPGAVQVTVQGRKAVLTGDILADEVDNLVRGVTRVRGVNNVQNNLHVHNEAGNIPQLQGEGWLPGQNRGQWTPSTRLLATVGAGYLVLYGTFRGGFIGSLARLSGLGLGARALTNLDMRQMTGMTTDGNAIRVRKSITIDAPVDEVYRLWSNFENFPRFMANVDSIHNQGGDRSHWMVKGPAGAKVEFDAIMTENIPDELIAWETTPDSTVKHHGQVRFRPGPNNRTQVHVNMSYSPPAGVAGHIVANLFGKDPKSEMDADLARMKSLLEEGKTRTESKTVTRQEVMPVTGGQGNQGQQQGRGRKSNRGGGQSGSGSSDMEEMSDTDIIPNTGAMSNMGTTSGMDDMSGMGMLPDAGDEADIDDSTMNSMTIEDDDDELLASRDI